MKEKDKKKYPCEDCGKLRSENDGGKIFTVCDTCWEKKYPPREDKYANLTVWIDHGYDGGWTPTNFEGKGAVAKAEKFLASHVDNCPAQAYCVTQDVEVTITKPTCKIEV